MNNLDLYCVTDKKLDFLEKLPFQLGAVGNAKFNEKYIMSNTLDNIFYKEKNYSELTFHYWFWKNKFELKQSNWIGFCQKRRFWINPELKLKNLNSENYKQNLLLSIDEKYKDYESIICDPIKVSGVKKIKLLKRGFKNIIKDPTIFFKRNKQTILLHFDMHHGYGNLEKAIDQLDEENREDFKNYVNKFDTFNPHIMFISKPEIINKWFESLFSWLEKCEKIFEFENLKDYDTGRLFAYLAERYLSYWFKKNTNFKEENWTQLENF